MPSSRLVERTFRDGLQIPIAGGGSTACVHIVDRNAERGVTWLHCYVTDDHARTVCIYDAPNPEAIRATASADSLPSTASRRSASSTVVLLASSGLDGGVPSDLARAKRVTGQFRNVDAAKAAGYGALVDLKGISCIDMPGEPQRGDQQGGNNQNGSSRGY